MSPITFIFASVLLFQATFAITPDQPINESRPYVIGGESAVVGEFPYQAALIHYQKNAKRDRIICGGSVLNDRWILTSANCDLKPHNGEILVKVGQLYRNTDTEYVQTKQISLVVIHKNFVRGHPDSIKEYDLALLKLASPLLLNERVQPVHLPLANASTYGQAVLSGFGPISSYGLGLRYHEILQKANVTVISKGNCEDAIGSVSPKNNGQLTDRHICTGPLDSTVSACADDLGSPLVQKSENGTVLVGLVSWSSFPCGLRGSPTVYTHISDYVDWIVERVTEN